MSKNAADVDDPRYLVARFAYRTDWLLTKLLEKDDPVAFVRLIADHRMAEPRQALEVAGRSAAPIS